MEKLEFLSSLTDRTGDVGDIVKSLYNKKEEIEKQIHLAKVLGFVYKIEDLVQNKVFELNEMDSLELFYEWDYDVGNILKCVFNHKDNCDYEKIKDIDESSNPYTIMNDYVEDLLGFSNSMVSESFIQKKSFEFKLDGQLSENLFKLMLSKELNTVLECNILEKDLPITQNKANKANKL